MDGMMDSVENKGAAGSCKPAIALEFCQAPYVRLLNIIMQLPLQLQVLQRIVHA